jgi:glutamate formiminotransferase / formiminotetrahydrofolate cyclodeaminase
MKIVECVPNFSEGRDKDKINSIVREIETVPGIKLLDVDPGESTNRTVVTFIGAPDAVLEAAFRSIRKASDVIDMRYHKGAHSRIGATDVCPIVPVSGVTMEECVRLARDLGKRVADELGIPVYLYEEAASVSERKSLADIRAGEYEGLADKLRDPAWTPDFGKPVFNPGAGATVIGAREFLIAYNINLNTRDRKMAHEIALNLRESGRARRDKEGNIVRDAQGNALKLPGRFKDVRSVGWYVEDYGIAQISINFINYKVSPVHEVFDETVRQAEALGLRVTGSELVGLIPKEALLMAGRHYLEKQGKTSGLPEEEIIRTAVISLGLSDVAPFDPDQKIIENRLTKPGRTLVGLTVRAFVDEVSMDSPAPGGGSVAALCGALSAALSSMVANLTFGKKGYEDAAADMKATAIRAQVLKKGLIDAVDLDTLAFNRVMEAYRLPKGTEEQKAERERAVEAASKEATLVPLGVLESCVELARLAGIMALKGNRNSVSDAGVAGLAARAAGEGAYYNVKINLPNIGDGEFKSRVLEKAEALKTGLIQASATVSEIMEKAVG